MLVQFRGRIVCSLTADGQRTLSLALKVGILFTKECYSFRTRNTFLNTKKDAIKAKTFS